MSGTTELSNPFVEWLNGELAKRGWTRQDLARQAHISSPGLTHIMNRQRNLGPDTARQIAQALGISQIELFQRAGLINETSKEDEFAERDIQRLLAEMDTEQRRIAINILEAIARTERDRSKQRRKPAASKVVKRHRRAADQSGVKQDS